MSKLNQADLLTVDREKTPWLLVLFHVPWYNSNNAHQGEGDKMMEALCLRAMFMLMNARYSCNFTLIYKKKSKFEY